MSGWGCWLLLNTSCSAAASTRGGRRRSGGASEVSGGDEAPRRAALVRRQDRLAVTISTAGASIRWNFRGKFIQAALKKKMLALGDMLTPLGSWRE